MRITKRNLLRRMAVLAMAGALSAGAGPATAQTCGPVNPCGDIDATGSVNTTDALKVLKKAVGQDQVLTCACSQMSGSSCEEELATATASLDACTGDLGDCNGDLGTCTGDLSDCNDDLGTCTGDLGDCSGDLGTCTGNLTGCNGNLVTCTGDLGDCNDNLGSCEGDLAMCASDLSATNADLLACQAQPVCGNGLLEEGEDCEVNVISLVTCASQDEFAGGTLRCGVGCTFDTSGCWATRFDASGLTILDRLTGLQWEKKNASNSTQDLSNPHDVDNVYSWSGSGVIVGSTRGVVTSAADGTLFTDFLSRLNGSDDVEGYAGHSDWRIPTIEELQTITVLSPGCTTAPCVPVKVLLPNRSTVYWTNTTAPEASGFARAMDYSDGEIVSGAKTGLAHVRAVRTGLDTGN